MGGPTVNPNSPFIRRLQRFMLGRYGQYDHLNRFLNTLSLLLIIVSLFIRSGWLILVALFLLLVTYWRLFSKKIYRQVAINRGFERGWLPITRPVRRLADQLNQHRRYRFFRCSQCHQRIRIPKHHGHVRITCPKCGHQFDART